MVGGREGGVGGREGCERVWLEEERGWRKRRSVRELVEWGWRKGRGCEGKVKWGWRVQSRRREGGVQLGLT